MVWPIFAVFIFILEPKFHFIQKSTIGLFTVVCVTLLALILPYVFFLSMRTPSHLDTFDAVSTISMGFVLMIVTISTRILSTKLSDINSWFHFAILDPEAVRMASELSKQITSKEDLLQKLRHILFEIPDYRVAGETLMMILTQHPNEDVRSAANDIERFIQSDPILRRAASPILNYMSEKKDYEKLIQFTKSIRGGHLAILWSEIENRHRLYFVVKRVTDIVLSVFGLLFFSPVIPILSYFLKREGGTNSLSVLYTIRMGKHASHFSYIRLNAMSVNSGTGMRHLGSLGLFVLSSGLDRIITLVNVLAGEMSIVGPHPLNLWQHERLAEDLRAQRETAGQEFRYVMTRLAVKPGLTGPAQLQALRDSQNRTCKEYLSFDIGYVEHLSIWNDMKIIIETLLIAIWLFMSNIALIFVPFWGNGVPSPLKNAHESSGGYESYKLADVYLGQEPAFKHYWAARGGPPLAQ